MKRSNYLLAVIFLAVVGISLAWWGVFKTEEYRLVKNYLNSEIITDKNYNDKPNYFLISFKVNGGQKTVSHFTFLILDKFDSKLITLSLDKKIEPWKIYITS